MDKIKFLHKDILKIFPWVKPRTLISWSERGLIKPDFEEARGRGSSRIFSYKNLMQIGIISELLRYGIPFLIVKDVIENKKLTDTLKRGEFDTVFWVDRELISADVPMDQDPPFISEYRIAKRDAFIQNGGEQLLGKVIMNKPTGKGRGSRIHAYRNVTSAVVINLKSIKHFVDGQIERITI